MELRTRVVLLTGLFVVVMIGLPIQAQSANGYGWDLSAVFNLTHTQSAYSDNWDGDEQGQLTWNSQLNMIAQKQLSSLLHSRNALDLEYGQAQTQDRALETWSVPAKNADKIDLESVLRFTLDGWVDPYVSGRFLSQFTDNRSGDLEYINPITLTESAGIAKTLLKNEDMEQEWLARVGLSVQQHMDRSVFNADSSAFESQTVTYAGIELVTELLSKVINDNLKVNSKLIVFQALYNSEKDDLTGETKDYWRSPDFDWETVFTANITKVLMVNLTTRLLYDKEVNKAGRFRETLAAGITYMLF